MTYSYYDYLLNYYHDYYDYYYETYYWPQQYGIYNVSEDSWCDPTVTTTASPLSSNATGNMTTTAIVFESTVPCTPRYDGTFPPNPFPYEKWWYDGIDTLGLIFTILSVVWTIAAITVTAIFFKQLWSTMHTKGRVRPDKLTIFLSVTCMLSHVVYNAIDVPYFYYWYFAYDGEMVVRMDIVWESFWLVSKVSIYSLYAYRYYKLQQASIHDQSTKSSKQIRFGLILLCILMQIGLEILYGVYYFDSSTTGVEDPDYLEKQRMYLNAAWAVMAIDFLLVLFLGYLIMGTILQLAVAMSDPLHKSMANKTEVAEPTQTVDTARTADSVTQPVPSQIATTGQVTLAVKLGSQSEDRAPKHSSRQTNLIQITTRIALVCMISLVSSLFMQFFWIIMEETENWGLLFFSYFWGLDALVNMVCVYFSMAFAKEHYLKVCGDILKCHHCCLWCVVKLATYKTAAKEAKEVELETAPPPSGGREDADAGGSGGGGGYESPDPAKMDSAADPQHETDITVDSNEIR